MDWDQAHHVSGRWADHASLEELASFPAVSLAPCGASSRVGTSVY